MFNRNFKIKVNSLFDWMELDMVRYVLLCVLGELFSFLYFMFMAICDTVRFLSMKKQNKEITIFYKNVPRIGFEDMGPIFPKPIEFSTELHRDYWNKFYLLLVFCTPFR